MYIVTYVPLYYCTQVHYVPSGTRYHVYLGTQHLGTRTLYHGTWYRYSVPWYWYPVLMTRTHVQYCGTVLQYLQYPAHQYWCTTCTLHLRCSTLHRYPAPGAVATATQ